jgi:acetyl/propionyl-CoA carboxylase alpha subunit
MNQELNFEKLASEEIAQAMAALVRPGAGYVGANETLLTALGLAEDAIVDFRSLPGGRVGRQTLALRYLLLNGPTWQRHFAWQAPLERVSPGAAALAERLLGRLEQAAGKQDAIKSLARKLEDLPLVALVKTFAQDPTSDEALHLLATVTLDGGARQILRRRACALAHDLCQGDHDSLDLLLILSHDLADLPFATVSGGRLEYLIVADKGEMGARAVREAVRLGFTPVAVYSEADDKDALAVRLAEQGGGFAVPLAGTFRESYANPVQIADRTWEAFRARFGEAAAEHMARAAVYPGYGPLAENTVAIAHFRRSGMCFVGPTQDAVERAGDKRRFRSLAESIDPKAVTPGITMSATEPAEITAAIERGHAEGKFTFPGRIKAANGGGGRGQAVIQSPEGVSAAVHKVLAEITANGWDSGVMFEQNIFQTTHLEVQVVRDRFGNTRHFGMRDCTEQRASQKIQEEAPPALLAKNPELEKRVCQIAVEIADRVGYLGACTVELMYKDGHFYLLEMNTRIQVEHPVTEEAHRIRRQDGLHPLNLVALQIAVACGLPIDFSQADVVRTHVAREFRINAESYKPDVKDPRDGKLGLFLPNGGVFDVMEVPSQESVLAALTAAGVRGIAEMGVRFDCGFEVGDRLVNKDPTFGKLIVSVQASPGHEAEEYELLRLASLEVLRQVKIEGRQVTPAGKVLGGHAFETNLSGHIDVLESEMLRAHSQGQFGRAGVRHVGWVIDHLRAQHADEVG